MHARYVPLGGTLLVIKCGVLFFARLSPARSRCKWEGHGARVRLTVGLWLLESVKVAETDAAFAAFLFSCSVAFGRFFDTTMLVSQGLFGRLAGALKYISPWKKREDPDVNNVPLGDVEDAGQHLLGATDDLGNGVHRGTGSPERELLAFAKTLPTRLDWPNSGSGQLDEITDTSVADTSRERFPLHPADLHTEKIFAADGADTGGSGVLDTVGNFGAAAGDLTGAGGAGRVVDMFGGDNLGGLEGSTGFGGITGRTDAGGEGSDRGMMVRPRGIRKELMMPLRVAQTVARMGKENIQNKRALALKFAGQDMKAFMPSSEPTEQGGETSAFRIAVPKPRSTSFSMPIRVLPSQSAPSRRGQQHMSYLPFKGENSILSISTLSQNASELDSSSMVALANTTVGVDSTMRSSWAYGSPSMLQHASTQRSSTQFSAAKQALASISAALSPMDIGAAMGDIGAASASRQTHDAISQMSGCDQYSLQSDTGPLMSHAPSSAGQSFSRTRMASALREDVGSKRMRESFAPEPSPLLAYDRSSVGAMVGARPMQRRRVSQPSNAVKKIMDIIKDTSTPHTDARATPSSRFFNSSSIYSSRPFQISEDGENGTFRRPSFASSSPFVSPGSKRSDTQDVVRFSFKEPESTQFAVETTDSTSGLNRAVSGSNFIFSEPYEDKDDGLEHESVLLDTSQQSETVATASEQLSLSEMFKPKPGEWDCPKCMTRNKADAKVKCMACEEVKPGGSVTESSSGDAAAAPAFTFGIKATVSTKGEAPSASSGQLSLSEMFKPKPGEWDCPKCMTRNKADAKVKCMACEEAKPGADAATREGRTEESAAFQFGSKAPVTTALSSLGPATGFVFGCGASAGSAPASSSSGFTFGVKTTTAARSPAFSSPSFGSKNAVSPSKEVTSAAAPLPSNPQAAKAAEAAKKGWVTTGFVFPDKREDTGFERSGNKEIDEDDAAEGHVKSVCAPGASVTSVAEPAAAPAKSSLAATRAAEAAKKGWVTTGFVFPEKKMDIGFERSGNKELDDEDAVDGRVVNSTSASSAPTASLGPILSLGTAAPTGGTMPITSSFTFGALKKPEAGSSGASSLTAFTFGAGAALDKTEAVPVPTTGSASGSSTACTSVTASSTTTTASSNGTGLSFNGGVFSGSSGAVPSNSSTPSLGSVSMSGASSGFTFGIAGASSSSLSSSSNSGSTSAGPPVFTFGGTNSSKHMSSAAPAFSFAGGSVFGSAGSDTAPKASCANEAALTISAAPSSVVNTLSIPSAALGTAATFSSGSASASGNSSQNTGMAVGSFSFAAGSAFGAPTALAATFGSTRAAAPAAFSAAASAFGTSTMTSAGPVTASFAFGANAGASPGFATPAASSFGQAAPSVFGSASAGSSSGAGLGDSTAFPAFGGLPPTSVHLFSAKICVSVLLHAVIPY